MRHVRTARFVLSFLVPLLLQGQGHSRRGGSPSSPTARAGGLEGVTITFHGAVKKISKKELLLASDENQLMTIRCSSKTRFYDFDNKKIKPTDIDLEARVIVDANEDVDAKLLAVNVKVEAPDRKTLGK